MRITRLLVLESQAVALVGSCDEKVTRAQPARLRGQHRANGEGRGVAIVAPPPAVARAVATEIERAMKHPHVNPLLKIILETEPSAAPRHASLNQDSPRRDAPD